MLALVLQHPLERAPTGIQHGLRQPCPYQVGTAHIAYVNGLVLIDDSPAELVKGIDPAVDYFAMQALRLSPVPATLRIRKLGLGGPKESRGVELFAVACRRGGLQSQIDANSGFGCGHIFNPPLYRQGEPPISHCILCEATLSPNYTLESLRLEYSKSLAADAQMFSLAQKIGRLEWHPSQRAP